MIVRRIENVRDADAAFERFRGVLAESNFRIESGVADEVSGTHGGMMQKGDNPLKGTSPIRLKRQGRNLALDVEFGGLKNTSRFLFAFPIGLCLFLAVLFGAMFGLIFAMLPILLGFGLAYSFRSIVRSYRDRAIEALDTLAHNLAEAGGGRVFIPPLAPKTTNHRQLLFRSGGLLVLVSLIAFFVIPSGMVSMTKNSIPMKAPGTKTLSLVGPKTYTVFYEARSPLYDGPPEARPALDPNFTFTLTQVDSGQSIPVRPRKPLSRYSYRDRAGYSVAEFTIPETGDYKFTAETGGTPSDLYFVVSISPFDVGRIPWFLLRLFLVLTFGLEFINNLVVAGVAAARSSPSKSA